MMFNIIEAFRSLTPLLQYRRRNGEHIAQKEIAHMVDAIIDSGDIEDTLSLTNQLLAYVESNPKTIDTGFLVYELSEALKPMDRFSVRSLRAVNAEIAEQYIAAQSRLFDVIRSMLEGDEMSDRSKYHIAQEYVTNVPEKSPQSHFLNTLIEKFEKENPQDIHFCPYDLIDQDWEQAKSRLSTPGANPKKVYSCLSVMGDFLVNDEPFIRNVTDRTQRLEQISEFMTSIRNQYPEHEEEFAKYDEDEAPRPLQRALWSAKSMLGGLMHRLNLT